MKGLKRLWGIVWIIGSVLIASVVWANPDEWAGLELQAQQAKQPFPVLSSQHPELDVKTAYEVQKMYVTKRLAQDQIAGFKAGLTSAPAQQRFGVETPLAGVLFASGKKQDRATISLAEFNALTLETEIGFVIGTPITQALKDVADLQQHIAAVMPAIELPDLSFTDMQQLKGVDIIASDISVAQFIVGAEKKLDSLDLNALTVTLALDGQEINKGQGKDALGDQWQAALWLANAIIAQGWTLEPGQVMISGALGKALPGKPGKYLADYGNLGKITFEVK